MILLISLHVQAKPRLILDENLIQQSVFSVLSDGQLVGSGFVIDREGYALTAAHLINKTVGSVNIVSRTLGITRAQLIGVDRGRDLALLKLSERDRAYSHLEIAKRPVTLAQTVCATGTAVYRHGLTLCGRVARLAIGYEYFPSLGHYVPIQYVAAHTPSGTSGGPWLNASGRVVGIQIGAMQQAIHGVQRPSGVSYMLPSDKMMALVDSRKSILRPTLGVGLEEVWESQHARAQNLSLLLGLVIAHIPTNDKGSRPPWEVGERILKLDRLELRYRDDSIAWVRSQQVGQRVRVTIRGKNQTIRIDDVILQGI